MRHGKYEPEPIPTFWKSEMALGKITELEYYKHIYPRTIIKEFIEDIDNILHAQEVDWREILEVLKEEYEERVK